MATKKVTEEVKNTEVKTAKKASSKKAVKATIHDFDIIIAPIITEKSMAQTGDGNKATFKVAKNANKIEIKNAIQRIYGVKVEDIKTVNVNSKNVTRGTRYHGTLSGYKKAIVTIAEGEAIDLFRE